MHQKELNEIRRHLTPDKNNIRKIYGCYVNQMGHVITSIEASCALMADHELEQYLNILKKTLSGGVGKHLAEIPFTTEQVMDGEEHKLLMDLYRGELDDEAARDKLFQRIIAHLDFSDSNYLILLAYDVYDIPYRSRDVLASGELADTSFSYIICGVCPVKDGKTGLSYAPTEREFRSVHATQLVAPPLFGFMFPTFSEGATDIYNAFFYEKDASATPQELVAALFQPETMPLAAGEQRNAFCEVLEESLGEECRFDVIQDLHEHVHDHLALHKEAKIPDTPVLPVAEIGEVLRESGVSEAKVATFEKACAEKFGADAALASANILNSAKFEIATAKVKIDVAADQGYVIETRTIDGRKYILIPATEGTTVNGVEVHFDDGEDA